MNRNVYLLVISTVFIAACGSNRPGNLQEAGATADAQLAAARPAMATMGAQAGNAASTAAAYVGPAAATAGAAAGGVVGTAEAAVNDRLLARRWQWTETQVGGRPAVKSPDPKLYTVTFIPGGVLDVKADCKSASGSFTADKNALSITINAAGTATCEEGSEADAFLEQLGKASVWTTEGGNLAIGLSEQEGSMYFIAP